MIHANNLVYYIQVIPMGVMQVLNAGVLLKMDCLDKCGETIEKLKTLDDLWKEAIKANSDCDDEWAGNIVARHLLKTEAINWIKELQLMVQMSDSDLEGQLIALKYIFGKDYVDGLTVSERRGHLLSITWFLKLFFGISSEELEANNVKNL